MHRIDFSLKGMVAKKCKVKEQANTNFRHLECRNFGFEVASFVHPIFVKRYLTLLIFTFLTIEGSVNYQGLLSILQLLPMRSCPLKLQVCTTVLDLLYRDQTAIPKMGKLPGWQDVIVRLLIKTSLSESPVRRNKSYLKDSPEFNEIEESIDDEVDGANGDEDSDINCASDLSQDPEKISKASDYDTDVFDNEDSSTDFGIDSPPHVRIVLEGNVPSAKNSQQFVDTVINILVQLMWTGVQGSDEDSWIVSCFCLDYESFS